MSLTESQARALVALVVEAVIRKVCAHELHVLADRTACLDVLRIDIRALATDETLIEKAKQAMEQLA